MIQEYHMPSRGYFSRLKQQSWSQQGKDWIRLETQQGPYFPKIIFLTNKITCVSQRSPLLFCSSSLFLLSKEQQRCRLTVEQVTHTVFVSSTSSCDLFVFIKLDHAPWPCVEENEGEASNCQLPLIRAYVVSVVTQNTVYESESK